jgi:sulfoxide reductase heme-binding subunit YedZ
MLNRLLLSVFAIMSLATAGTFLASAPAMATTSVTSVAATQTADDLPFGADFVKRAQNAWPWYVTRGSGILAAIIAVLLLLSGIGLITGHTYRVFEPLTAWVFHRALGVAFGVATIVHVVILLIDKFAPFDIWDVLVPFMSDYKPLMIGETNFGSVFVALGVIALYALVTIILTSYLWIDKRPRAWRVLHYLSYVTVIAIFFHGLFLGTDLQGGLGRILWVMGGLVVLGAFVLRLQRSGTTRNEK